MFGQTVTQVLPGFKEIRDNDGSLLTTTLKKVGYGQDTKSVATFTPSLDPMSSIGFVVVTNNKPSYAGRRFTIEFELQASNKEISTFQLGITMLPPSEKKSDEIKFNYVVSAFIKSVTNLGVITIEFSEPMIFPPMEDFDFYARFESEI